MMEDDRLSAAPIFVVDLSTVFRRDSAHVLAPFLPAGVERRPLCLLAHNDERQGKIRKTHSVQHLFARVTDQSGCNRHIVLARIDVHLKG